MRVERVKLGSWNGHGIWGVGQHLKLVVTPLPATG